MQDLHEESLIRIHKDIQDKVTLFGSTQERNAILARAGQIAKPTDDTVTMQFFNSPNNIDTNNSSPRQHNKNFVQWNASTEEYNSILKKMELFINPTENSVTTESIQDSNEICIHEQNSISMPEHSSKKNVACCQKQDSISMPEHSSKKDVACVHEQNSMHSISQDTSKKSDSIQDNVNSISTISLSPDSSNLSEEEQNNLAFLRDHYLNSFPVSDSPNHSFGFDNLPFHSLIFKNSLPAPSFPLNSIVDNRYKTIRCLNEDSGNNLFLVKPLFASDKEYFILETFPKICCSDPHNTGLVIQSLLSLLTLRHERIISIYEFNITQDNILYIIYDYIPSAITLHSFLKKVHKLSPSRAISILIQLLRIVRFYHDNNIIHGNLNPHNILIVSEHNRDFVYIKSFAFYPVFQQCLDPTKQRVILGDVHYLAPEYIHTIHKSCDIYSLGVIFFELLTGSLPFSGNLYHMLKQKYSTIPDLSLVPDPYHSIIEQALDTDVSERFQSANDFLTFVKQFKKVSINYHELSHEKEQNHFLFFSVLVNCLFILLFLISLCFNFNYCKQLDRNFSLAIQNQEHISALYLLNTIKNNYFYNSASIIYPLKSKTDCQKQYNLLKQQIILQQHK